MAEEYEEQDELMDDGVDAQEALMAEERARILDALGMSLAKTRQEAIEGRRQSGIEDEWLEDEEFYEAIDDANRNEKGVRPASWRSKPVGAAEVKPADATGSTIFVPITRAYCDAASARVADMLLPSDDRAWGIRPTPFPEMAALAEGNISTKIQKQISEAYQGAPEQQQAYEDQTKADIQADMKARLDEAREKAERAETRIEDWHVECQWHAEVRKVIDDAVKGGTGILKGPVPERKQVVAFIDGEIALRDEIKPTSRRVDKWNFYPDPVCGECLHNGSYTWERDTITRKQLERLKGGDYLDEQIDEVLREGPHKATHEWDVTRERMAGLADGASENMFEIWYGYCRAGYEDLMAAGLECEEGKSYDVMVTMVNNRVIKAALNHLDTGEFPYDAYCWQSREGMVWGISLARQLRTPQRLINGAMRNMADNAGIAGGPMLIMKRGLVVPANGVWEICPRKMWFAGEDELVDDVSKAMQWVQAPMAQQELEAIVNLALRLAEDVSGMPLLMQGQQGQAPDTVGGMQILQNNAGTVLRRVARLFDDRITEPHVRRYYAYLMQYGDDDEKGDFLIDARGSSALVERDLQNQQIMQMGAMVANPIFGVDPKKWMVEYLKSQKLDPSRFEYDDEEWQQVVQNMQQPPPNPAVEVANIRSQTDLQLQQMKDAQAEREMELEIAFKGLDQELDKLFRSADREDLLSEIKASLAETVMKLRTQTQLSRETMKPPTEPAGRAPDGQAFQR